MDFPGTSNGASRLEHLQLVITLYPCIFSEVGSDLCEALPDIVMSGSTLSVPLEFLSVDEGKTPRSLSLRTLATCVQIAASCLFGACVPIWTAWP